MYCLPSHAAAYSEDHFPQRGAHRYLNESRIVDVAGKREGFGPRTVLRTDRLIPGGAFIDDHRHIGIGLDIIQVCGLVEQPVFHGTGRLDAGHSPLALDRGGQSGTLSADKCACAAVDMHMEGKTGPQDIVSQKAHFLSLRNGNAKTLHRKRIFCPDIDVTL